MTAHNSYMCITTEPLVWKAHYLSGWEIIKFQCLFFLLIIKYDTQLLCGLGQRFFIKPISTYNSYKSNSLPFKCRKQFITSLFSLLSKLYFAWLCRTPSISQPDSIFLYGYKCGSVKKKTTACQNKHPGNFLLASSC